MCVSILFIADDALVARTLGSHRAIFKWHEAASLMEAASLEVKPDVVVLDLYSSNVNGIQMIAEASKLSRYAPIIVYAEDNTLTDELRKQYNIIAVLSKHENGKPGLVRVLASLTSATQLEKVLGHRAERSH